MSSDFRRIRFSKENESPLSEGEEYSLWSNHIRMLFTTPAEHFSIYDRPVDCGPSLLKGQVNDYTQINFDEKKRDSLSPSSSALPYLGSADIVFDNRYAFRDNFLDTPASASTDCYPLCFYLRMMRNSGKPSEEIDRAKEADVKKTESAKSFQLYDAAEERRDSLDRYSSVSHHEGVPRECAMDRNADLTKHQVETTRPPFFDEGHFRPIKQTDLSSCIRLPPFSDARVELQQAKLMDEMTDLLIYVRKQNAMSSELSRQLIRSKYLMSFEP